MTPYNEGVMIRCSFTLETPKSKSKVGKIFGLELISSFGPVFLCFWRPEIGLIRFLGVLGQNGLKLGFWVKKINNPVFQPY
jgi:hypothetical protein